MRLKLTFLLSLVLSFSTLIHSQIPGSRTTDWSKAGVRGGIPTYTKTVNYLNNGGKVNDASADNTPILQNLLNSLAGTGTVIIFPKGTYRFKGQVNLPNQGKVILRGEGSENTFFEFETGEISNGNFTIWGGEGTTIYNVSGGHTKGSTKLTLNKTTGLKVGDWIDISQENDATFMATNEPSHALTEGPRSVGQVLKISAINGNTITVDRPLRYTYKASLDIQVKRLKMTEWIGFENFTIKSLLNGRKHHFLFVNAANCWIKCVSSIKSVVTHVNPAFSANITIRGSHFHDMFEFGGGGYGGGVCITSHSTDILVENNVFDKLRHAMLVQRGANGCVFGYNYSINATSSGTVSPFTRLPDISLHGHFPYMNIYEGNVAQEIHSADYWGPSGHGDTFFRNWITREGIRISDNSIEQNVVGNMLIKDNTAQFTTNEIVLESGINTLLHGNYVDGKTTTWDPNLGNNNLIDSYYHNSKPVFFGNKPWPCFGPEFAQSNYTIPAMDRYLNGVMTDCENNTVVPPENKSQFVIQNNVPGTMGIGATANVSITLKNTGTTTWISTGTNRYRLGSQNTQDNKRWGLDRVDLPKASVAPNEQATFAFTITAPLTPGTYNFQWKMVQEGVEWFGDLSQNVQIKVTDPNLTDIEAVSAGEPFILGCTTEIAPQLVVRNHGPADLTTATIAYSIDGGTVVTKTYSVPVGSGLKVGDAMGLKGNTSTISAGTHNLKIWSTDPNKNKDINTSNDTLNLTFTVESKGKPLPFSEDFEQVNAGDIPADWSLYDPDDHGKWFVHSSGTNKAAAMNNYAYTDAQNEWDYLTLPPLDLTGNNQVLFSFDFSHASKPNATVYDSLEVMISADCGMTFSTLWGKGGKDLNTVPDAPSIFVPSGTQDYENVQINLSAYNALDQAILRFVNWSNNGNSTLIDNVNITTNALSSGNLILDNNNDYWITVFPNPAKDIIAIQYSMKEKSDIEFQILNAIGQIVYARVSEVKYPGIHQQYLDMSGMDAGIYFLTVRDQETLIQKKIILVK